MNTDRWRNEHGVEPYAGLDRKGNIWDVKTLTIRNPQEALD